MRRTAFSVALVISGGCGLISGGASLLPLSADTGIWRMDYGSTGQIRFDVTAGFITYFGSEKLDQPLKLTESNGLLSFSVYATFEVFFGQQGAVTLIVTASRQPDGTYQGAMDVLDSAGARIPNSRTGLVITKLL